MWMDVFIRTDVIGSSLRSNNGSRQSRPVDRAVESTPKSCTVVKGITRRDGEIVRVGHHVSSVGSSESRGKCATSKGGVGILSRSIPNRYDLCIIVLRIIFI